MTAPTFPMPVARMRAWFNDAATDFGSRLAPAYVALDWQWAGHPSARDIATRLAELFEACVKDPSEPFRSVSSGGLCVRVEWNESTEEWNCTMDFGTSEEESFGWESES